MRVRRARSPLSAGLAVIAVAVTVQGSAGAAQSAAPQPCARAQALLAAGYLTDAAAAFKAVLGKDACAATGITAVRLRQSTSFDAAVATIRRLEAAGFESEARKQVQALVVAYPDKALPADIRAIDQPISWWRQFGGDVGPPLIAALEIAVFALVVFIVARALIGIVRRAVRPRYTVRDVSGVAAEQVTGQSALLIAELARIGATSGGDHIRRVPAGDGKFDLPAAVTTAFPQAKLVAAAVSMLELILPRRVYTVTAIVLPVDPARGVGLTVALTKPNGAPACPEETFWESDFEFDPSPEETSLAERLQHVMLPAAVWLAYRPQIGGDAEAAGRLGTANWRSYAYFAIGERHQRNGDTRAARRAYYQAIDLDHRNLGARLNLAGLLLYRQESDREEPVAERRSRLVVGWFLIADHHADALYAGTEEEIRWRRLYLLAALHLAQEDDREAACRAADELWSMIKDVPDVAGAATAGPTRRARLHTFLWEGPARASAQFAERQRRLASLAAQMRWPTFVLRAGADMKREQQYDSAALALMRPEWWTANTLYNLACYRADAVEFDSHNPEHMDKACEYLQDAIDRSTEPALMLAMARTDPSLDTVVDRIGAKRCAALAGIKEEPEPNKADVERGRGVGLEIREIVRTLVSRNGHRAIAPDRPRSRA
jgi:hypothetical protein